MTMASSHALQGSTAESGTLLTCHPKAKGTKPNSDNSEDPGQKTPLPKKRPKFVAKVVSSGNPKS